jgi:asparagine synthase (glutamine-hydrolysing)
MPKEFLRPTTKYILGKAIQGTLLDEVLRQPKAGFGTPVDCWLANDLREMVHDLLAECRVRRRGYLEPKAVRQLIQEYRNGREDWSMQIWRPLTFELWLQTFMDGSGKVFAGDALALNLPVANPE